MRWLGGWYLAESMGRSLEVYIYLTIPSKRQEKDCKLTRRLLLLSEGAVSAYVRERVVGWIAG